ncbi:MAG: hypothetical protein IJP67_06895, partial [Oscillospiraceae bacterium]|nr:hypothetical protein [Oscillospiraceae bacterium]
EDGFEVVSGWKKKRKDNAFTKNIPSKLYNFTAHRFGTTDPGIKGIRTVIFTGKYTEAASSDGWETHKDVTLQPATSIYFEQHEKGYGRSTIAGHCVIDTNNWTADMTELLDPEANAMTAKDFLAKYAQQVVVTVEDPSLDVEDSSLGYRLLTVPELALLAD